MTIRVGITGGMGSGKTTVCGLFSILDIPVYNADAQAKSLMVSDPDLKKQIIDLLGTEAYAGPQLNRTYIAHQVFENPNKLEKLNQLVHPKVYKDLASWFATLSSPYALYESALITRKHHHRALDFLIFVYASRSLRIDRIIKRNKVSKNEIMDRMATQPDPIRIIKQADYLIINDDRSLIPQILRIHKDLILRT